MSIFHNLQFVNVPGYAFPRPDVFDCAESGAVFQLDPLQEAAKIAAWDALGRAWSQRLLQNGGFLAAFGQAVAMMRSAPLKE